MEAVFRQFGVPEIAADLIAREVHRYHMRAVLFALVNNTVWIRNGNAISFMICDAPNYYRGLVT